MGPVCCNGLVQLNPYGRDAVLFAVELANDPPATAAGLSARCRSAGVVVDRAVAPADLATVLDTLEQWFAVVDSASLHERAGLLNAMLADGTSYPRLTDHVGEWHLHYRDDGLALGGVVRVLIATGTALHLVGLGMDRLGRCGVTDCDRVYADMSRGGSQRYCSTQCANRDAVRRHRARHADSVAAHAETGGPATRPPAGPRASSRRHGSRTSR